MPEPADRDRVRTAVARVADRAERAAGGRHADIWERYVAFTESDDWDAMAADHAAAYANLVGISLLREAEDILTLGSLIELLGSEELARVQNGMDKDLGLGDDAPLVTLAVRVLSDEPWMREQLISDGVDPDRAAGVAARNHHYIPWLLVVGVRREQDAAEVATAQELTALVAKGSVTDWRAALAPITKNPWGPATDRLVALAERADLDVVAHIVEEFRSVYRTREERREREYVAREIRRLVALSGLTQRDFAAYVGTSASRLSTYVAGKVTPSAAMLLRIRRAATSLRSRGQQN